jgi:hypothetical protein
MLSLTRPPVRRRIARRDLGRAQSHQMAPLVRIRLVQPGCAMPRRVAILRPGAASSASCSISELRSPTPALRWLTRTASAAQRARLTKASSAFVAPHLRAVLAAHVALQLMNRRALRSPHDVERDGLVRVAAEASDFETAVARIDRAAQRRRWLGWPPKPSMRLFHASHANRSACLRASAARSAAARTDAP